MIPAVPGLFAASRTRDGMAVIECKGTLSNQTAFSLQAPGFNFWMVFQFGGKLSTEIHGDIAKGQYRGLHTPNTSLRCKLGAGRVWSLFLGVAETERDRALREWPSLHFIDSEDPLTASVITQSIAYRQEKVFDQLRKVDNGSYSLAIKVRYHLAQLLKLYHEDLDAAARSQDLDNLVLYHQAVDYIRSHYMEASLGRDTLARALHVTVRKLNRAFQGRANSLIGTIRLVRLYRARELLQTTSQTVEEIANALHFTHSSHMGAYYTKLFGYSPVDERKRGTGIRTVKAVKR